ncbi:MAG: hypothetical protein HGB12_06865 [Bacteroidetes bacterium]|nr:hypothetical protein [Bacteroidota bacterium]
MTNIKTFKISISIIYAFFTFHFSLFTFSCFSQGVAINVTGDSAVNSAIIDVNSSTQGALLPRMTTSQRNLITAPASGLFIYNTDCNNFNYYDGNNWIPLNTNNGYIPAQPGVITGLTSVCANASDVTYSIVPVSGAISYLWSVPAGSIITSTQGTTSITVNFGNVSGNINVTQSNACGTSSPSSLAITVLSIVGTPAAITVSAGTEPTCQLTNGTTTTTYSTTATDNTGFNWSLSNGAAGSIGSTTGILTWTNDFSGSVNIQVTASGCDGPSSQTTRTVIVNPLPATPTATAGTNVNSHQITANWNTVSGSTSYLLDVSSTSDFSSFAGTYNSLNAGNTLTCNITGLTAATTYYYRVRAVNSCGAGGNSNTITTTTSSVTIKVLVVAGGGGSGTGSQNNGGGGAGGLLYDAAYAITAQAYNITVGAKGAQTANGSNSVFGSMTAIGGGHGAYSTMAAGNGGSGGGGAPEHTAGGTGTGGQGNSGGNSSGGLGGAGGGAGGAASGNTGGPGISNSISGTAVTYAGGGKPYQSGTNGAGYDQYGGGAQGDEGYSTKDGVVIISAAIGVITSATGGTHTQVDGNDIWTFTSSGTWTPTF